MENTGSRIAVNEICCVGNLEEGLCLADYNALSMCRERRSGTHSERCCCDYTFHGTTSHFIQPPF
jgi:hypothetical protein